MRTLTRLRPLPARKGRARPGRRRSLRQPGGGREHSELLRPRWDRLAAMHFRRRAIVSSSTALAALLAATFSIAARSRLRTSSGTGPLRASAMQRPNRTSALPGSREKAVSRTGTADRGSRTFSSRAPRCAWARASFSGPNEPEAIAVQKARMPAAPRPSMHHALPSS